MSRAHPHVYARPVRRLVLAAALLAPAAACSRAAAARGSAAPAVVFVNQGLEQAAVYAVATTGGWQRVGTAAPGQTVRLRIPSSFTNQTVNIIARPLATPRLATSGPITIVPGDTYTITLQPSATVLSVLPGTP